MSIAKQWIMIEPLDTLFLKGSEPMIAGMSHEVRSVFPPMPSTLIGALRTAVLQQRGIRIADFVHGPLQAIRTKYPYLGEPDAPGFKILGPLFRVTISNGDTEWLLPAPASWFAEASKNWDDGKTISVSAATALPDSTYDMGLCSSVADPLWVRKPQAKELKSLCGQWINIAALRSMKNGKGVIKYHDKVEHIVANEPTIIGTSSLYMNELRVGIARDNCTMRTKQGHLYSASHIRLQTGVTLSIGISEELISSHLDTDGILQLGGEQRIARYELLSESPPIRNGDSAWVLTLAPIPFADLETMNYLKHPRMSGPFIRMGGWDMKQRFHKPMKAYLPIGAAIMVRDGNPVPFGFMRI
jgi:CRISPR-associated protein Cmr3